MGVGMWTSPGSITGGSGVTYWTRLGQLSRMMRSTSAHIFVLHTAEKTIVLPMRKKPPDDEVVVAENAAHEPVQPDCDCRHC
ncbi:MAG: hypothetical protein R2851_05150 [Caldilineaceae bacterium]